MKHSQAESQPKCVAPLMYFPLYTKNKIGRNQLQLVKNHQDFSIQVIERDNFPLCSFWERLAWNCTCPKYLWFYCPESQHFVWLWTKRDCWIVLWKDLSFWVVWGCIHAPLYRPFSVVSRKRGQFPVIANIKWASFLSGKSNLEGFPFFS